MPPPLGSPQAPMPSQIQLLCPIPAPVSPDLGRRACFQSSSLLICVLGVLGSLLPTWGSVTPMGFPSAGFVLAAEFFFSFWTGGNRRNERVHRRLLSQSENQKIKLLETLREVLRVLYFVVPTLSSLLTRPSPVHVHVPTMQVGKARRHQSSGYAVARGAHACKW